MKVSSFILSRYAEVHDGLYYLQGAGLNRFYHPAFPSSTPPVFLLAIVEEDPAAPGRYAVRVRQKDADGKMLSEVLGEMEITSMAPSSVLIMLSLGFPTPGDYLLEMETAPAGTEKWESVARKSFKAEFPSRARTSG